MNSSASGVKSVLIQPSAIFSIFDQFQRRSELCSGRLIGAIFGTRDEEGLVTVSQAFPIPHSEINDQVRKEEKGKDKGYLYLYLFLYYDYVSYISYHLLHISLCTSLFFNYHPRPHSLPPFTFRLILIVNIIRIVQNYLKPVTVVLNTFWDGIRLP